MKITFIHNRSVQIIAIITVFIAFSVGIALIPTNTLIDLIGSNNAWLVMFILGIIGGTATVIFIPYQLVLMSFAAGGINPIWLGFSTAMGVMIGNSCMYLFGKKMQTILSPKQTSILESFATLFRQHPRLVVPFLVLYGIFSPISNNYLIVPLSMLHYSYTYILVPLTIGNVVYHIGLAYIGIYAYDSLFAAFF
jgi:membrane protein YqaA with SNARE-associated domain